MIYVYINILYKILWDLLKHENENLQVVIFFFFLWIGIRRMDNIYRCVQWQIIYTKLRVWTFCCYFRRITLRIQTYAEFAVMELRVLKHLAG